MNIDAEACCNVALPTAFTPNNDGRNDVFRIITNGHQEIQAFVIVNRWGQKVFESHDQWKGWDGTFRGKNADIGVYNYYIKYLCSDGQILEKKGDVVLMR